MHLSPTSKLGYLSFKIFCETHGACRTSCCGSRLFSLTDPGIWCLSFKGHWAVTSRHRQNEPGSPIVCCEQEFVFGPGPLSRLLNLSCECVTYVTHLWLVVRWTTGPVKPQITTHSLYCSGFPTQDKEHVFVMRIICHKQYSDHFRLHQSIKKIV